MPESIKHLIEKFVLNQCTPEEEARLVHYFQRGEMDDFFPEVDDILKQLKDKRPELTHEDSEKLYKRILKKAKGRVRSLGRDRKRNINIYWALAAVFAGIIGLALYFEVGITEEPQQVFAPSVTISSQPETGIRLITGDGSVQNLSGEGQKELTDTMGNVLGTQEDNTLTYHAKTAAEEQITYNTLEIPYGKRFQLKLADGTQVYLNSGSSLRYPVSFPKEGNREVSLSGEAFFDVSKDAAHPFKVHTDKLNVEVLGTQFNVNSYQEESSGNVVLVEGSVDLSTQEKGENKVRLIPGQLAEIADADSDYFEVKEVNTDNYTMWMDGGLVFRDVTFEEMLRRMGRHYNITIVNNNKELGGERFNASFDDEPLETILQYFSEIYKIDYTKKESTIIVQ